VVPYAGGVRSPTLRGSHNWRRSVLTRPGIGGTRRPGGETTTAFKVGPKPADTDVCSPSARRPPCTPQYETGRSRTPPGARTARQGLMPKVRARLRPAAAAAATRSTATSSCSASTAF
jgi:hypothetical protein